MINEERERERERETESEKDKEIAYHQVMKFMTEESYNENKYEASSQVSSLHEVHEPLQQHAVSIAHQKTLIRLTQHNKQCCVSIVHYQLIRKP